MICRLRMGRECAYYPHSYRIADSRYDCVVTTLGIEEPPDAGPKSFFSAPVLENEGEERQKHYGGRDKATFWWRFGHEKPGHPMLFYATTIELSLTLIQLQLCPVPTLYCQFFLKVSDFDKVTRISCLPLVFKIF